MEPLRYVVKMISDLRGNLERVCNTEKGNPKNGSRIWRELVTQFSLFFLNAFIEKAELTVEK